MLAAATTTGTPTNRRAYGLRGLGRPPLDPEDVLDDVADPPTHPRRHSGERQRRDLPYAALAWVALDQAGARDESLRP